jgi:hypothetical protein
LVVMSFCRWGHPSVRRLDACSKYGMAATVSRSLAVGEGDEEDVGIGSGNEGRGGRQARLQRRKPGVVEASEGRGT